MDNNKSSHPELMADFFDKRAETYDDHQKKSIDDFDELYKSLSMCITKAKAKVQILDIGCGTGLELEGTFERAPNALVTDIDISAEMLNRLIDRFQPYTFRITPIQDSYLSYRFKRNHYDYIVAAMTLHHLLADEKKEMYRKILKALKIRGVFIECDFIVSKEEEREYLIKHRGISQNNKTVSRGSHHVDISMSLDTQRKLLIEAGFSKIDIVLEKPKATVFIAKP